MRTLICSMSVTPGTDLARQFIENACVSEDGKPVTEDWLNRHEVCIPIYHDGHNIYPGDVTIDGQNAYGLDEDVMLTPRQRDD